MSSPSKAVDVLIDALRNIQRYEASIGGGCECCGSWVEHEKDKDGDWVKYDDLLAALSTIGESQ